MNIQTLEVAIEGIATQVLAQDTRIVELEKQLTDMQEAVSCGNESASYEMKSSYSVVSKHNTQQLDGVFGGVVSI